MRIIVWNSQGNRWSEFFELWVDCILRNTKSCSVLCLLVESGVPDWVPRQHDQNKSYSMAQFETHDSVEYNCTYNYWPWFASDGGHRRCSFASVLYRPRGGLSYSSISPSITDVTETRDTRRPCPVHVFVRGSTPVLQIIQVHTSRAVAQTQLDSLIRYADSNSIPTIIVGDMNIDLKKVVPTYPASWTLAATGFITHRAPSPDYTPFTELDWGVHNTSSPVYAKLIGPLSVAKDSGGNKIAMVRVDSSDHAVILYDLPAFQ